MALTGERWPQAIIDLHIPQDLGEIRDATYYRIMTTLDLTMAVRFYKTTFFDHKL